MHINRLFRITGCAFAVATLLLTGLGSVKTVSAADYNYFKSSEWKQLSEKNVFLNAFKSNNRVVHLKQLYSGEPGAKTYRSVCVNAGAETDERDIYRPNLIDHVLTAQSLLNVCADGNENKALTQKRAFEHVLTYINQVKENANADMYNPTCSYESAKDADIMSQVLAWGISDGNFLCGTNAKSYKYGNTDDMSVQYYNFSNQLSSIGNFRNASNVKLSLSDYVKFMLTGNDYSSSLPTSQTTTASTSGEKYYSKYYNIYTKWMKLMSELYTVPSFTSPSIDYAINDVKTLYYDSDLGYFHNYFSDRNGVINHFVKSNITATETDTILKKERAAGYTKLLKMYSNDTAKVKGTNRGDVEVTDGIVKSNSIYCTYNPDTGIVHIISTIDLGGNTIVNDATADDAVSDIQKYNYPKNTQRGPKTAVERVANVLHWIPTNNTHQNMITVGGAGVSTDKAAGTNGDVDESNKGTDADFGNYIAEKPAIMANLALKTAAVQNNGAEKLTTSFKLYNIDVADANGNATDMSGSNLAKASIDSDKRYQVVATYKITDSCIRGDTYTIDSKESKTDITKAGDRLGTAPDNKVSIGETKTGSEWKYKGVTATPKDTWMTLNATLYYNGAQHHFAQTLVIPYGENSDGNTVRASIESQLTAATSPFGSAGVVPSVYVSDVDDGKRDVTIQLRFPQFTVGKRIVDRHIAVLGQFNIGSTEQLEDSSKLYVTFQKCGQYTDANGNNVLIPYDRKSTKDYRAGFNQSNINYEEWKSTYHAVLKDTSVVNAYSNSKSADFSEFPLIETDEVMTYKGLALAQYDIEVSCPTTTHYLEEKSGEIVLWSDIEENVNTAVRGNPIEVYTMIQSIHDTGHGTEVRSEAEGYEGLSLGCNQNEYWYRDKLKIGEKTTCTHFVPICESMYNYVDGELLPVVYSNPNTSDKWNDFHWEDISKNITLFMRTDQSFALRSGIQSNPVNNGGYGSTLTDSSGYSICGRLTNDNVAGVIGSYKVNPITNPRKYLGSGTFNPLYFGNKFKAGDSYNNITANKQSFGDNSLKIYMQFRSNYTKGIKKTNGNLKYEDGWVSAGNKDTIVASGSSEGFELKPKVTYMIKDGRNFKEYTEAHPNNSVEPTIIDIERNVYKLNNTYIHDGGNYTNINYSVNIPKTLYARLNYVNSSKSNVFKQMTTKNSDPTAFVTSEDFTDMARETHTSDKRIKDLYMDPNINLTESSREFAVGEIPIFEETDSGDFLEQDGTIIIAVEYTSSPIYINNDTPKQTMKLEVFTPLTYVRQSTVVDKSSILGKRVPGYIYDYRTFDIKIPDSAYNKGGLQGVA